MPVFYLGATNEGGYNMFNVNLMQERLEQPMTIEMIPNYRHYNFHEIQFIDFLMWVAHIFDGRPISKIVETSHEYRDGRNYYRAKVESKAKIQLVRTWFVYAHNPEWRDLMWFEWLMRKEGDYYETSVPGRKVDAYMIEVGDTAMGFPGYVTSLPIKLTDAPVKDGWPAKPAGWDRPRRRNRLAVEIEPYPRRNAMMRWLLTLFLLVGLIPGRLEAEDRWVLGMEELHRVDLLPRLKPSVYVGSVSSYDRSGGNDDGFSGKHSFVAREDDALVIADIEGPGIIYRIWTPTPTDDVVEFYFDGEPEPRIRAKFRALFTGNEFPFVSPLVGYGAGGFYSYVPLAFRKSCKVLVRAARVQFYQINYACYPDDAPISTWQASPSDEYRRHQEHAAALFASSGSDLSDRVVPPGCASAMHRASVSLEPGSTATLFETTKPGRIAGLRIAPAAALEGENRDLLLRIRWDDDEKPAVLCPAGDFFGYAWGRPAMKSLLVGTAADVSYCYFPMPFDKSAKIELVSERKDGPPVKIRSEVVFAPVARSADEGKFYALWRRENPTTQGTPFTFVEAEGSGHVFGCILQCQGMVSGNTYFFEGDDQTTIDGETTIHGTGSEDFFNGGWYDVPGRWEKRLSFPLSGCLGYQKHLGRTGGYRLMLGDAVDLYAPERSRSKLIPLGTLSLEEDFANLMFKLVSKNEQSSGLGFDLVTIQCERIE